MSTFVLIVYETDRFTKTGSGQTYLKVEGPLNKEHRNRETQKEDRLFVQAWIVNDQSKAITSVWNTSLCFQMRPGSGGAEPRLCGAICLQFTHKNVHFTKARDRHREKEVFSAGGAELAACDGSAQQQWTVKKHNSDDDSDDKADADAAASYQIVSSTG